MTKRIRHKLLRSGEHDGSERILEESESTKNCER